MNPKISTIGMSFNVCIWFFFVVLGNKANTPKMLFRINGSTSDWSSVNQKITVERHHNHALDQVVRLVSEFLQYGLDQQNATVLNRKLLLLVLVNYHVLLNVEWHIFSLAIRAHRVFYQVVQKSLDCIWTQRFHICLVTVFTQFEVVLAFLLWSQRCQKLLILWSICKLPNELSHCE